MPIDVSQPLSPGWWFRRLMTDLGNRQARYNLLDSYQRGDPPMPWGPTNCRPAFQQFQRKARANFGSLIVEAVRERMVPTGFRTGAGGDDLGDSAAWGIWQANGLDALFPILARSFLSMSDAYMIVGGPDPSIGAPLITVEDPRQVITAADPRNRRRVIAALKVFADDVNQADIAYLYLPGWVGRAVRRRGPQHPDESLTFDLGGWDWYGQAQPIPVGSGIIPVVRFPNRPDLAGNTLGEFEDVVDSLDRVNLMLLQRLTVAVMQAFRQRAIKGDLPEKDEDGEDIDYSAVFENDPGALWELPAGVDLWESAGVDLTPLLESVKADVRDIAATTRTPMHYLFPDSANGSAEGASLMREGLFFKVSDRIIQASDPLEQVMSLAFLFAGDPQRAARPDMEVIWNPPEKFSVSEKYAAAALAKSADVPRQTIWSDVLQFSPQQRARMEAERLTDQLTAPPTPDVAVPVGG